jgi:hypothetical protein
MCVCACVCVLLASRHSFFRSECQKQDWSSHSIKCRAPLTAEQLPVPTMPHAAATVPALPVAPPAPLSVPAIASNAPPAGDAPRSQPSHPKPHLPVSLPLNRLSVVSFGTLDTADVNNDYILVQPDAESALLAAQEPSTSAVDHKEEELVEREVDVNRAEDQAATAPRASLAESLAEEPVSGGETAQLETCYCGQPTLFECSGCGLRGYCSSRCQRKDWARHKAACRANSRRRTSSGSLTTPSTPAPFATPVPYMPVAIPSIRQPLASQVTSRALPPVMEVDDDTMQTPRPASAKQKEQQGDERVAVGDGDAIAETRLE